MPNMCENELSVSGPAEVLKKFRDFANPLIAELFLPIPDCTVDKLSDMVVYRFDTAYAPPMGEIEKMAKMYPTLSFLFSYGGIEVQCDGSILFKDGYPLVWKNVGWLGDLYVVPEPLNFSDNFRKSLYKKFPGIFSDPACDAKK